MAVMGNTPMASFQYLDPYGHGGHNDQSFMHAYSHNNPASDFTAPGYLGGILPMRQYMYQSFTNYTLTTKTPFGLAQPSYNESQPAGDAA